MSKDLKITKERVLEASKTCEDAKSILKTLFPEAFNIDPEWEEVHAGELEFKAESNDGGVYFTLWDALKNQEIACMDYYAQYDGAFKSTIKLKLRMSSGANYKIIPNDIEKGVGNFKVFRSRRAEDGEVERWKMKARRAE